MMGEKVRNLHARAVTVFGDGSSLQQGDLGKERRDDQGPSGRRTGTLSFTGACHRKRPIVKNHGYREKGRKFEGEREREGGTAGGIPALLS